MVEWHRSGIIMNKNSLSNLMFFISVFKFVNEKLERIPGDGVFKAAASSPTDSGAGTGSMICTVFGSIDNNNKHLLLLHTGMCT